MANKGFFLFLFLPLLLMAQSGLDVTGRVSLRMLNTGYDTTSKIKPDSIPDSAYAKTTLIPGFEQSLNLALFARTSKLDMTLLGDIRNNPWNPLNTYQNVTRLTLNVRYGRNEFILGDFFDAGSELFIQSREVRGAKADITFGDLWGSHSYLRTKFSGGEVQKAFGVGHRLYGLYHQYETSGQYRRYFASGIVRLGDTRYFDIGLKYLYGKDDQKSISSSINEPLTNQVAGGEAQIYLWKRRIKFFGEGYLSRKDTLTATNVKDFAYKGGVDVRYGRMKLVTFYQRLGYDYYSAGYPYLQNDRQGLKVISAYLQPGMFTFSMEGEQYYDNLNHDATRPRTTTRMAEAGITTHFKSLPELTLKGRFRDDKSNTILDTVKTDKISRTAEMRVSFGHGAHRLSFSALYIKLDDRSVLISGSPVGTEQLVGSVNFYSRPSNYLFLSGGSVYSMLTLTNQQKNTNVYAYLSGRWDIVPRRLKLEANMNWIYNDAANGGYSDMLSDYNQIQSEISLEYFFNSNISLKLVGGVDRRHMNYTTDQALQVIADPEYGPLFFNSFESYDGIKYGAEINWIF